MRHHRPLSAIFAWIRRKHLWYPSAVICTAGRAYTSGSSNLRLLWFVRCVKVVSVRTLSFLFILRGIVMTHARKILTFREDLRASVVSRSRIRTSRTRMESLEVEINHNLWWDSVYFRLCSRLILLGITLELILIWLTEMQQIMKRRGNNNCKDCLESSYSSLCFVSCPLEEIFS